MASSRGESVAAEIRWWLEGDEVCGHCLQLYVYEHRIHCHYCDGPICPQCVETVAETQWLICAGCSAAPEEE